MTIIIKVFASFDNSENCKRIYEKMCETHLISEYGIDKKYYITDQDDYTHVIILNTAMPELKIPRENVIGFAFEPIPFLNLTPTFVEYAKRYISKYYIGDLHPSLPTNVFIEKYSYMWHNPPITIQSSKPKIMSIMVSHKQYAPGHQYRHTLVKKILELNLPIDIYGNGCKNYENNMTDDIPNPYIKGGFEANEPYVDYQFHICIENFVTNHYFSEKIANTLLCGTTPVYLGCKNINDYFPNNVICLTGDVNKDIVKLMNILKNPKNYQKKIDIPKIKDQLNFVKHIPDFFRK